MVQKFEERKSLCNKSWRTEKSLWMLMWTMGGHWIQPLMYGIHCEHGCMWALNYIITFIAWQFVTHTDRASARAHSLTRTRERAQTDAGGACSRWALWWSCSLLMNVRPVLRSAGSASAHVFRRQRKCHSPRACWEKPGVGRVSLLLSSQQIKAKRQYTSALHSVPYSPTGGSRSPPRVFRFTVYRTTADLPNVRRAYRALTTNIQLHAVWLRAELIFGSSLHFWKR